MAMCKKEWQKIALGLGFLAPNIFGFLTFTVFPLFLSICMAFTDWNLEMHNYFRFEPVRFVGFDNFIALFRDPYFWRYFGNTLFLMLGLPFGVAGSLGAALLLNIDLKGKRMRKVWIMVLLSAVLTVSLALLLCLGFGGSAMTLLMISLFSGILLTGTIGGQSVYRTLFYFPYFTAGVATYILWKKLYAPVSGPVNNALRPLLAELTEVVIEVAPAGGVFGLALLVLAGGFYLLMVRRKLRLWRDGESGSVSVFLGMLLLSLPLALAPFWCAAAWDSWNCWSAGIPVPSGDAVRSVPIWFCWGAEGIVLTGWLWFAGACFRGRRYDSEAERGIGDSVIIDGAAMAGGFILVGLACVCWILPSMVLRSGLPGAEALPGGLMPPLWLTDYYWAKPSLMLMGFWGAVGSNNMLLFLAGLSGVPQELYEAADIDGASAWQRFWHVTWPQLSNVTFFIMIMSVISGLQGGFEMARTMTDGGPAGSTTTLAYYIYNQGFATGRLGYASAVAWVLFMLVFLVTAFNWKFGSRYSGG